MADKRVSKSPGETSGRFGGLCQQLAPLAHLLLRFGLASMLAVVIVACGGGAAEEAAEEATRPIVGAAPASGAAPVEAPAAEPTGLIIPTEAPAAPPVSSTDAEATPPPDPALVNTVWQWVRRANADGVTAIIVDDPNDYQIVFGADGALNAGLDCYDAAGRYATGDGGAISLELAAGSATVCPEESLADEMAGIFGPALGYRFEEDGAVLVLFRAEGGPLDYFRSAGAAGGETDAGEWAVDAYEHIPDPELIDVVWVWERREPDGGRAPAIQVTNPESYTLQFAEDGSLAAHLDCDTVRGRYAAGDDGEIFLDMGPATLTPCAVGSLAEDMAGIFGGGAQTYGFEEDGTVLVLTWGEGGPVDYYRNTGLNLPTPESSLPAGTTGRL